MADIPFREHVGVGMIIAVDKVWEHSDFRNIFKTFGAHSARHFEIL